MKWLVVFVLLFAVPTLLKAEVKQGDIDALRALVAQDKRLATTGYRLAKANEPFCKNKAHNPGWVLHSYRQYGDVSAAKEAFSFPLPVAIAALVKDGPAAQAGLRVGDSFSDLPGGISWGADRVKHKANSVLIDSFSSRVRALFAKDEALKLPVRSKLEGADRWVTIDPPPVCASYFLVSTGKKADAGADGERVRVSAKLAEFTPDEDEFAFIVAHEMAHNILEHRKFLDSQNVKRGFGRMFGKSKKLIRQTEVEADQLAVWLMANAGYDPTASVRFIERYGRKFGHGIFSDGTHYRWRKRQEIMQQELDLLVQTARGLQGYSPPLLKGR